MIREDKILKNLKSAIGGFPEGQTELVCESTEFQLTRFAESQIHQNMGRSDSTVWCRKIVGQKIGVARSNDTTKDGLNSLTAVASDIAKNQKDNPDFNSLVSSPRTPGAGKIYQSIERSTPISKAAEISKIIEAAGKKSLNCAGTFETSQTSLSVVNSLGTEQFGLSGEYRFTLTTVAPNGRSGWAQAAGRDLGKFDIQAVSQRAIDKASFEGEQTSIPAGLYTVILEPDAVANFMLFLGFLGFGAKTFYQKRSFMSGKVGEKIMGDNITILEDPAHPLIEYLPFDYEGVPRRQVIMIENGLARNFVSDSFYSNLTKTESTGNGLPPDNNYGPYPKAMVMMAGSTAVEDMIKSTANGIYVTRFWYLNFLNPMKTLVTGYTRDGTFLIEDGKISRPLNDLRIQQSMIEAFSNVESISSEQRLIPQYGALMLAPFMKINNFNLSPS